jgi:hypothetical protein
MKLSTVAARLFLTGAVATTLAVAQAPQAYARCGIPSLHEAMKLVHAMEADPRYASAQAQLKAIENRLQQIGRQAVQLGDSVKKGLLADESTHLLQNLHAVAGVRG